jgi:hypothetical protein
MSSPLRGKRCLCPSCGKYFTSTATFDKHRTGTFKPMTRRCFSEAELIAKGWEPDARGAWRKPAAAGAFAFTTGA